MHQGQPRVSFILRPDKSEKDRQPQEDKNELNLVCIIVVTDVSFLSI
jgi:hypothetical protein